MKNLILAFFLFFTCTIFSQNAFAELKFEEAETAFNNGNYALTIQKVDEFEDTLGNMTDKSLYLRVISQSKLFNVGDFYLDEKQFTLYNSLISNSKKYLKATENNGLNDKFKEVYAISQYVDKLNLPKDKTSYEKEIQNQKDLNLKAEQNKIEKQEYLEKLWESEYVAVVPKIDAYELEDYTKIGIKFSTLKRMFPDIYRKFDSTKYSEFKMDDGSKQTMYYDPSNSENTSSVWEGTKYDNSVFKYVIDYGKFDTEESAQKIVDEKLLKMKTAFGEKYIKTVKSAGDGYKSTSYSTPSPHANYQINLTITYYDFDKKYHVIAIKYKLN
ncbi:hypothetical protein [Flavobacterium mesophilum]|uniref:hypothetical protein n=1 Tax=Flavobacterium mesophilum TaxID=3143495 RepID=UPI0031CF0A8E